MLRWLFLGIIILGLGCEKEPSEQRFTSTAHQNGTETGNGGGLSEKYILYAYSNLSHYIHKKLDSAPWSAFSPEEYSLLKSISSAMYKEYETKNQIQFISGKENPGFFDTDEPRRIARTGSAVGDYVFINRDQLYVDGQPLTLLIAVQILVHELGHHHGVTNHTFLDQVATHVCDSIAGSKIEARYSDEKHQYVAQYWEMNPSVLLVSNGQFFQNLTESILTHKWCHDREVSSQYAITNLFWSSRPAHSSQPHSVPVTLRVQAKVVCLDTEKNESYLTRRQELAFVFDDTEHMIGRLKVLDCLQDPSGCW